jgi:hypothetical protein
VSASIINMNLTGLVQYRSTLVDFKRQEKSRKNSLEEQKAAADADISYWNLCGGIVAFQIELVDALIEKRKADQADGTE